MPTEYFSSSCYLYMQLLFAIFVVLVGTKVSGAPDDFRPPAVPLIVFSPHISGESFSFFSFE